MHPLLYIVRVQRFPSFPLSRSLSLVNPSFHFPQSAGWSLPWHPWQPEFTALLATSILLLLLARSQPYHARSRHFFFFYYHYCNFVPTHTHAISLTTSHYY